MDCEDDTDNDPHYRVPDSNEDSSDSSGASAVIALLPKPGTGAILSLHGPTSFNLA